MNRENKKNNIKKVIIKPTLVMTALPVKYAAGLLCRQALAVTTATIVQTACAAFM